MARKKIDILIVVLLIITSMLIFIHFRNKNEYADLIETYNNTEIEAGLFLREFEQTIDSLQSLKSKHDSLSILLYNCEQPQSLK